LSDNFIPAEVKMSGNITENSSQCANPEGIVERDSYVMLSVTSGGQADMTSSLPSHLVAENS